MKAGYVYFLLLAVVGSWQCSVTQQQPVTSSEIAATELKPFGRTSINSDNKLELISSASHVGFRFDGRECSVTVSVPSSLGHNYLQYELDGQYQQRLRITSKEGEEIVISAPGNGRHTVWLYKATEAHTGPVFIHSLRAKNLEVLERPAAPLIEFIGNSITCGAAADTSEVPCGAGVYHDQHNAYMAYGPRVARALKTNFLLSSVSGIGIYRNWNSDGPAMPQVYENTDFQNASPAHWNFKTYPPDIVSIALGTNDFSRGDGKKERRPFDSTTFVKAYIDFVQLVKTKYPAAQIALLSSPMVKGEGGRLFQNCLTAVKAAVDASGGAAKPVALFFFQPIEARGCTGHPSVADHAIMAEQLTPFFKKLL